MLPLDDPRWLQLQGGYRLPYDPRPAIDRLAHDFMDHAAWEELWGKLHHQGDVGEASYATVPYLIHAAARASSRDWNVYAFVATIEVERHRRDNPPLAEFLRAPYELAWRQLGAMALEDLGEPSDKYLVRSALAVVALARGERRLGALISQLDESELIELADTELGWSQLYGDAST